MLVVSTATSPFDLFRGLCFTAERFAPGPRIVSSLVGDSPSEGQQEFDAPGASVPVGAGQLSTLFTNRALVSVCL